MTDGRPKTDPPTEAHDSNQLGGEEPAFYAAAAAVESLEVDLSDHAGSTSGVHGVGSSNVESEAGAQSKADSAESNAKSYTDDHENKSNPHGITVGKIGALDATDYNPESDTHSRYTDSEASDAAPVQSVNGQTGNPSLATGVDATVEATGTVSAGVQSDELNAVYKNGVSNPEVILNGSNTTKTILAISDTSSTYFTTLTPIGSGDFSYVVFKVTV